MAGVFQVQVTGLRNKRVIIDLCESAEDMKNMTVLDMKTEISKRLPEVHGALLLFGNALLDDERRTLASYGIQHRANILCCINLHVEQEKMYDLSDLSLTFVNGPDELDFEWNEYKSARAKMSCGHAVTPMSLTAWCRYLLSQGICKFTCPAERQDRKKCDTEWPYTEVRRMALLTPEERLEFEEKLSHLAASKYCDVKRCPSCSSTVIRNGSYLGVRCTMCTADRNGRAFYFCWQCLKEWKGPMPRLDRCDNDGCKSELDILRTCADIKFASVKGVIGCPSLRACPTCGIRVKHDTTGSKNFLCTNCKVEFCFVCLKRSVECMKSNNYNYYSVCSSGVAPRQTTIPVWKK